MRTSIAALLLFCSSASLFAAEQAQIEAVKTSGEVRFSIEDEATIIDIVDAGGIGRAELKRTAMKWPKKVVLRLHLKGLESLKVNLGETKLGWWVGGGPKIKTYMSQWVKGKETSLNEKSPWWTPVKVVGGGESKIPLKDGYFEIPLPDKMFAGNPETMQIAWVDFFRG